MFLFSLGNALEARTMERTRDSIRSLVNLFPTRATILHDGHEDVVEISQVKVGDIFIVRPGEKIPTDGVVVRGGSTVNEAAITGESAPVEKAVDDEVFAGSVNDRGSLEVRATATSEDNTLAKVIHLVEEAQGEKAPSQRFTEVFGRYYTPAVVALAILVAATWPYLTHVTLVEAVYISLTLLVVSCPCALVISTPVAIVSAIGNAARNGVLIKGGAHLEAAGGIKVVVFDKTGTITTGEAQVKQVFPANDFTSEQVLTLAASVESRSEHPLAQAILHHAKEQHILPQPITDFEALTGMGAAAKFDGATCIVGNSRLMEQLGVEIGDQADVVADLQKEGATAVMVATNGRLAGTIAISDTIRASARNAFAELRKIGIKRIVMLTGDNEGTARAVARELDVDEYYAELLPQDKVDIVRVLIDRFGKVAVVGDGVNDAPALAASTVGIAMGAAGSDVALETADIALMSDDLVKLPYAMRLSRNTLRIIRQNIAFALIVIGVLVGTTLAGWLRLSLGVFGHEGSALLVIANGMRLLSHR
jgi:Cd2+/Zn2+-exporting ATPase